MHLKQSGFTYSKCRPFTKKEERMQNFKETESYDQNDLDKACLQHDLAYGDFKDLVWRTAQVLQLRI